MTKILTNIFKNCHLWMLINIKPCVFANEFLSLNKYFWSLNNFFIFKNQILHIFLGNMLNFNLYNENTVWWWYKLGTVFMSLQYLHFYNHKFQGQYKKICFIISFFFIWVTYKTVEFKNCVAGHFYFSCCWLLIFFLKFCILIKIFVNLLTFFKQILHGPIL